MTVEEFIERIERATASVETNRENAAWAFAAERLIRELQTGPLSGTNLANSLSYILEGNLVSILAPSYILYQNYGVKGAVEDRSGAIPDEFSGDRIRSYGTKRPPANVFERYTTSKGEQFAIATNVFKFGIKPKNWFTKDDLVSAYTRLAQEFINDNI
jgi:hypothetical protein